MLSNKTHRYTEGVSQGVMLSNDNQMYQTVMKCIQASMLSNSNEIC